MKTIVTAATLGLVLILATLGAVHGKDAPDGGADIVAPTVLIGE